MLGYSDKMAIAIAQIIVAIKPEPVVEPVGVQSPPDFICSLFTSCALLFQPYAP